MNGGSQENNMRAGTSNVAGIVGMAVAAEESYTNMHRWNSKMKTMRDYMAHRIIEEIKDVKINGSMSQRSENNLNLSFKGINGYSLTEMLDLEGVCVSGTSACKAESRSVSNVLLAMGVPVEEAIGTIRITLSEKNTMEEIDRTISLIKKNVVGLRSIA